MFCQFLIANYLKVPNSYCINYYGPILGYDPQYEAHCKMQSINNHFNKNIRNKHILLFT